MNIIVSESFPGENDLLTKIKIVRLWSSAQSAIFFFLCSSFHGQMIVLLLLLISRVWVHGQNYFIFIFILNSLWCKKKKKHSNTIASNMFSKSIKVFKNLEAPIQRCPVKKLLWTFWEHMQKHQFWSPVLMKLKVESCILSV